MQHAGSPALPTRTRGWTRTAIALAIAVAACAAWLVPAAPANAAAAPGDETYTVEDYDCNNKKHGGGQFDNEGTFYLACGTQIQRWTAAGERLPNIDIWAYSWDVAPGPNGDYFFVDVGDIPYKVVKQGNGEWVRDDSWEAEAFPASPLACNASGLYSPAGRGVATDAFGNLYFSNGAWAGSCAPNMILRYTPDGTLTHQFGDFGNGVGQFNVNQGLAVSMDGRTIYTVEQTNSRVQRFDYTPWGTYEFSATWGEPDTNNCSDGLFAAPYDVGLDPWGYVYVMDTTCRRVQKFTEWGVHLVSVQVSPADGTRPHNIAVDTRKSSTSTGG